TTDDYDPINDVWVNNLGAATRLANGRGFLGGASDGVGLVYAIGGYKVVGGAFTTTSNAVETYDTGTGTWTDLTATNPLPTARGGLGAARASNGKIYVVGGSTGLFGSPAVSNVVE